MSSGWFGKTANMEKEVFFALPTTAEVQPPFLLISHFVEKLFAPFRFFWRKYEKGRVAKLYDYPRRSFFPSTIFSLNSVRGSCPGNRRWFLSKKRLRLRFLLFLLRPR